MRLYIFGGSGSGVTTLGQHLAHRLALPYFDSDDYFWLRTEPPYREKRDPDVRNPWLLEELEKAHDWILGGSVLHWGQGFPPVADLIIFLYLPPLVRMERLKKREWERYGDVIFNDPDRAKQYHDFLVWAADYDNATGIANRTLPAHQEWLAQQMTPVLALTDDLTTEGRIKRVESWLSASSH